MELNVCDDFRELLDTLWLEIYDVKCHYVVFEVPEIDAKVIGRNKILAIWTRAQCIDVVVMAVLKLLSLNAFEALTDHLRAGEHYLAVLNLGLLRFLTLLVVHTPELDDAVVRRQKLDAAALVVVQEI